MISVLSTTHLSTTARRIFSARNDLSTEVSDFVHAIFHTTVDTKNRLFSVIKTPLSTVYTLISYFIIVVVRGDYREGSTDVDTWRTGWVK